MKKAILVIAGMAILVGCYQTTKYTTTSIDATTVEITCTDGYKINGQALSDTVVVLVCHAPDVAKPSPAVVK